MSNDFYILKRKRWQFEYTLSTFLIACLKIYEFFVLSVFLKGTMCTIDQDKENETTITVQRVFTT
jgi:hypothetical protein